MWVCRSGRTSLRKPMLNIKSLFETLSDQEKEELKQLLLADTEVQDEEITEDKVEEEEPEFANAEVTEVSNEDVEEIQEEEAETEKTEESTELSFEEKQDYLVKFGYDETNVKYMNTDILNQAYQSAMNIKAAQEGTLGQ